MSLLRPRLATAGIILAIVALFAAGTARPASAAPTPDYDGIAAVALKYEGTWGGQCWTFMRQVVEEATGKVIGFDYREGFFEAGAIEVTVTEARSGDIIQIANDAYTAPDADYSGLHTAIILDNHGDGTFRVIDSNANWDEMVSIRENYDPRAAADRYGLNFHIYRITDAPATPSAVARTVPEVPLGDPTLRVGDTARVSTGSDVLNLRPAPGLTTDIPKQLSSGTIVTVLSEVTQKDGLSWVKVATPAGEGWVAAQYLTKVSASAPASSGGEARPILMYRMFAGGLATE